MPYRPERLGEMIREELIDVISGELRDPRVGLAQVTEVKIAPDLHVAHVFVSVMGGHEEEEATLRGLIAARGFLRTELARRLQIRQIPELRFELDRSEELGLRLDKLLTRAKKRSGKQSDDSGAEPNSTE
jgi:ribosome-binding factor A